MESQRDVNELEKLFDIAIKQTNQPDLKTYAKITAIINSNNKYPKILIELIKNALIHHHSQEVQFMILELIEFTTCRGTLVLHKEYNQKTFLKFINAIFNQNNLCMFLKERTLELIVFWKYFFSSKEDILGNFNWYYKNIVNRGIDMPPFKPSPYL